MAFKYPNKTLDNDENFNSAMVYILLITGCIILSIAAQRLVDRLLKVVIYSKIFLFIGAIMFAYIGTRMGWHRFDIINEHVPQKLIATMYYPVYLLHALYNLNLKRFFKDMPIVILYCSLLVASGFLVGYLMKYLYRDMATIDMLLIATTSMTTEPVYMIAFLSLNDSHQNVLNYLRGESIMSLFLTFPIVDYLLQCLNEVPVTSSTAMWCFCVGPIFGFVLGWLTSKSMMAIFRHLTLSLESVYGIVFGALLFVYALAVATGLSGYAAGMIFCLVLNSEKIRFLKVYDEHLKLTINLTYEIVDKSVFFFTVCKATMLTFNPAHNDNYFYCYTILTCLRIISGVIIYPLLKKVYRAPISHVYLHSVVCPTSQFSLIVAIEYYMVNSSHGKYALAHSLFNTGASMLVNNFFCINALKWAHIGYISKERIDNMLRALNGVKRFRDEHVRNMKLDRDYAEVNWQIVRHHARIDLGYPYPSFKEEIDWECKQWRKVAKPEDLLCCRMCPLQDDPTPTNQRRMEYKFVVVKSPNPRRMLKHSLISRDCEEVLKEVIALYGNDEGEIPIEVIRHLSRTKPLMKFLKKTCKLFLSREPIIMPRKRLYRAFYHIRLNRAFQTTNYIFTITLIAVLILEVFSAETLADFEKYFYNVIVIYFLFEIVAVIGSLATIKLVDGIKAYFKSFWHVMDMFSTLGMLSECIIYWVQSLILYNIRRTIGWMKYLRVFRLIRVITLLLPKMLMSLEYGMHRRMLVAYESALAMNDCINEVLINLRRWQMDATIRHNIRKVLLADKGKLQVIIMDLQADISVHASALKTKRIIDATRCCMNDYLIKLKFRGHIDINEYGILKNVIFDKKSRSDAFTRLPPTNPTSMFFNNYWVSTNSTAAEYLKSKAELHKWPARALLVQAGDPVRGVYVLIGGNVTITHRVGAQANHGRQQRYVEFEDDFVTQGNSFGEVELLTGRRYPYTLVCDSDCRTFFIDLRTLCEAMKFSNHPISGLEAVLWKRKTLHTASQILMLESVYQHQDRWTINKILQRSFVPDLRCYRMFVFIDSLLDVILLHGFAMDYHTKRIFKSPCYIPRTVRKLVLSKPTHLNLPVDVVLCKSTKLMLIPMGELDPLEILAREEAVASMIRHDFTNCPYHVTHTKGKTKCRRVTTRLSEYAFLHDLSTSIAKMKHFNLEQTPSNMTKSSSEKRFRFQRNGRWTKSSQQKGKGYFSEDDLDAQS